MIQEEIKISIDNCRKTIESMQDSIKDMQENHCKHTNTFEGTWSYRIGSYLPAEICSDCGKLIKYIGTIM
jgi:hypothetical protein